jgi:hypothetical protein
MSSYTCNVFPVSKEKFSNQDKEEDNEDYEDYEDNEDNEYYPNGILSYPYEDFKNTNGSFENFEAGQNIYVLGNANMAPWSATYFADQTAQWIWYSANAQNGAPTDSAPVYFILNFNSSSSMSVVVHVMADNAKGQWGNKLWLNGQIVGDIADNGWLAEKSYTQITIQLLQGNNTLIFAVQNLGGPAGLIASVIGPNGVIINSGSLYASNWSFTSSIAVGPTIGAPQAGVDYPGNDISDMNINYGQQCATACSQEQGCNGFITDSVASHCWLKSALKNPTSNTDRIAYAYAKPLPGTASAPPLTPNDFSVLLVGASDNLLYVQDVIGGIWNNNSVQIAGSGYVTDMCVTPGNVIYGVGMQGNLWYKKNLNATWVQTPLNGQWISVSVANDGQTLILVNQVTTSNGTGSGFLGLGSSSTITTNLYTANINSLNTAPVLVAANIQSSSETGFLSSQSSCFKVVQFQDGKYCFIYLDGTFAIGTGTLNNPQLGPVSPHGKINNIAQTSNGSIVAIDQNGALMVAVSPAYAYGGGWTPIGSGTGSCCYKSVAIMQIPAQNINGYDRKGAFIDNSSRVISNYVGTFQTLPECINAAQSQGYNTVGYQYMNQCFGGNNSVYDSLGFQTDTSATVSAYPGAWTNIVYKTTAEMVSTSDPAEGEVFLYQACQFGGSGSKMTIGQYPNVNDSVEIKSIKLGVNTKLTLYTLANFQGTNNVYYGYSDTVNKDSSCIDFTFVSAKVEKYQNALPSKPSDLTIPQLTNLWTQAGCKAESTGFNSQTIAYWKSRNAMSDVLNDMKLWATDQDPAHKEGCNTLSPQPNVPGEGEVVLFENCDYGGRYKKYGMGNVAFVGTDFNDITSSIKIGPYTSVTIYESINFGGKSATWKNDSDAVSTVSCLTSNNFNKMLSSLKVTSSTAQVNYSLDIRSNPVFIAGPWNTAPWSMTKFVDQTAQWIWYTKNSGQTAPVDTKPVRFQLIVPVSGNRDVPVTIHVIADNVPQGANFVKLNGQLVGQIIESGWLTPNYTQIQVALAPGNNLVEFDVQNTNGPAGLLVSIINTDTFQVVANSGTGQWGWVDPSKVISAILSEEIGSEFVIHDEAQKGKVVSFKNLNEITQIMVGGTFRLSMNLTGVPPYIKGQQYKSTDTNKFYLSIEKMDPNCQVQDNGKCMNIYVDNNKCANATLSNISRTNAYRLVLVSSAYVLDDSVPFGKNVDFTLVKVGDKIYLKNVQTGYMPKLFLNDYKQQLYGYMDTNYLSNINSLKSNQNKLCGANAVAPTETENEVKSAGILSKAVSGIFGSSEQSGPRSDQKFVNCTTNADGTMYMMTTTNLVESNPIKFVINKDGTISIRLQQYNSYGNVEKTYSLISCNFNVNTYAFIEKLTNPLGTFLVNMACFDPDDNRQLPKNTLNFSVEMSKYPNSYLKEKNIYNLNT